MNIEKLMKPFMAHFNMKVGQNEPCFKWRELYGILKRDWHDVPPPDSIIISDKKQLRLMARLRYMTKFPQAFRRGPGRPGRLRFSLNDLRFLMCEFDLKDRFSLSPETKESLRKTMENPALTGERFRKSYVRTLRLFQSLQERFDSNLEENPDIRLKNGSRIPSRNAVIRRLEGNEKRFRDPYNLVYTIYVQKKYYKGKPFYYSPGYCEGGWGWKFDKAIRENIGRHKRLLISDIRSTKDNELIPSPELDGVLYFCLEKQDAELIKELDPLAKDIQRRMCEYRGKFLGWKDGKRVPGFKDTDFRAMHPFMVIYYE